MKLANYEQLHQLTESGSFSERYKGLWNKQTFVVLKKPNSKNETILLEEESLSLWQREIKIHTALDHLNIVKIIASNFVSGALSQCFLIMVWCSGEITSTYKFGSTLP